MSVRRRLIASFIPTCAGLAALATLVFAPACTSHQPNVTQVDTKLEARGSTSTHTVGLDEKGDAILQEERALASEIQVAQHVNENIRMNVSTEAYHLKDCWKKRARGTTGEMPVLTDYDDTTVTRGTEEVGIVGGDIKVVRKEDAIARLKAERRRQDELRAHLSNLKRQREKCEFESARDIGNVTPTAQDAPSN